jgi:hypothetical protein
MAERYAIQKGDSFEVNLQTWGHVKHTKQNPLWEVPGFCYLAAINIAIPCDKPLPILPSNKCQDSVINTKNFNHLN